MSFRVECPGHLSTPIEAEIRYIKHQCPVVTGWPGATLKASGSGRQQCASVSCEKLNIKIQDALSFLEESACIAVNIAVGKPYAGRSLSPFRRLNLLPCVFRNCLQCNDFYYGTFGC